MSNIALLGTGLIGAGMVENLLQKGHTVRVWNRTAAKLAPLVEKGAVAAATPAEAVAGADRVHIVLTSDDAVDSVLKEAVLGEAGQALRRQVPVFDHSTNLPQRVALRYPALRGRGIRYVPAPVFMSPQNAREASGLMLLSAEAGEVAELTGLLSGMTGRVWHVGERPDLAAAHKLAGNSVLIGMSAVLGDTLSMGAAQGLSPEQVLSLFEVFKVGNSLTGIGARVANAGNAPVSFALSMARKDVGLMVEAAGGPEGLVVLPAVAATMDRAIAGGQGGEDYAVFASPRRWRR